MDEIRNRDSTPTNTGVGVNGTGSNEGQLPLIRNIVLKDWF